MKHDAIVEQGIPIHERVPIPDEMIPEDSRVEIDAKIHAGYCEHTIGEWSLSNGKAHNQNSHKWQGLEYDRTGRGTWPCLGGRGCKSLGINSIFCCDSSNKHPALKHSQYPHDRPKLSVKACSAEKFIDHHYPLGAKNA